MSLSAATPREVTNEEPAPAPDASSAVVSAAEPLFVEGLRQVLLSCDVALVHRCTTALQFVEYLLAHRPRIAFLDVSTNRINGLELLRDARRRGIAAAIVLIVEALRDDELLEAVGVGVQGLLRRDASLETVAACVRTVISGGLCVDQALINRALAALFARQAALRDLARLLTPRELEIFQMLVSGRRTRDIAESLCVSDGTVKVHLHHIYDKLQITGRDQLIAFAKARNLL
jgi:DNA-binding NarL/FixJ family response regulator